MVLSKQYVKGEIKKINEKAYVLKVVWCWYYLINYEECFVFSTIEEAKDHFLKLRADGRFLINVKA